jgi:uncharacterized membrane protein
MSTLVVLKFDSVDGARQMRERLLELQKQQLLQVEDAAIMSKEQLHNLAGAGALGGAFWGMLFGLLFFIPILGLAVGAAAGALAGSMSDVGIDDKFIKQVGESITPGTAALFLLVSNVTVDKVLDQIKDIKFEVLQTNLSHEQEDQLRSALGQTPAGGDTEAAAPAADAPATPAAAATDAAAPASDTPAGDATTNGRRRTSCLSQACTFVLRGRTPWMRHRRSQRHQPVIPRMSYGDAASGQRGPSSSGSLSRR